MKAIHFTRAELEVQSSVTDADVAIAVALWIRFAPSLFRYLIESPTGKRIQWDAQTRDYVYPAGQHINSLELRERAIEPFLNNVRLTMRGVSEKLQRKEITLVEWQREQTYLVKYSQIAAALIANGGAKNNTQADYTKIALFVLALLLFFQNFSDDLESGKQILNGTLLARTDLYAGAGRDAYEEMRRYVMEFYLGKKFERRVLGLAVNHCHTVGDWTGCPELALMGWKPIGTLPRLMDTPCRSNCRCSWEFK